MEAKATDSEMWASIVEADRRLAQLRADFYHRAAGRVEILRSALGGSNWERASALEFLQRLPTDVPELAEVLAGVALSEGSALRARRALQSSGHKVVVREKVARWRWTICRTPTRWTSGG
jgi:hypothetical protein